MTPTAATAYPRRAADRRDWLDALYERYHNRQYIDRDPIVFAWRYDDPLEREVAALPAALLAYGNVKAILSGVQSLLDRMDDPPRRYLLARSPAAIRRDVRGWRYRVTSDADITALLIAAKRSIESHGSMHAHFASCQRAGDATVIDALGRWVDDMAAAAERPLLHLLPHPSRGSACKRPHLYLRWMVRRDAIDPGGWTSVSPAHLIVPLDTHMHAMARLLRLTRRRSADGRTAVEITRALARIRPDDPVRYDFALTRPGILRTSGGADASRYGTASI